MYIVIRIDGSEYVGKESDENTAGKISEEAYQLLRSAEADAPMAMRVILNDGGILVLGREALMRAQVIYYD